MVAYSFKKQFAAPILAGQKLQTIRAVGKRRHARMGDRIQLYIGMRTKHCRLIATRICASVHQVELRILPDADMTARVDGKLLTEIELGILARADGFGSIEDMWVFWRENHKNVTKFDGLLIKWEPSHG